MTAGLSGRSRGCHFRSWFDQMGCGAVKSHAALRTGNADHRACCKLRCGIDLKEIEKMNFMSGEVLLCCSTCFEDSLSEQKRFLQATVPHEHQGRG